MQSLEYVLVDTFLISISFYINFDLFHSEISGVIASSGNLTIFEPNNTSLTNDSHHQGTINKLNPFKITSVESELIDTKTTTLPSVSLVQNDGTNDTKNAKNSENITTDNAKPDTEIEKLTTMASIIDFKSNKIQSTKSSLRDIKDVTNRSDTSELIESFNDRKETQSTASIEMITTNKPCKYILFIITS